jgi:hypothetical protein
MAAVPNRSAAGGPTPLAVAPDRWIRKARRTRGAAFLALVFALGWAAIFFAATGHPHAHETAESYVGFGVCFFGGAVLCVLYARRLSRAGLLLTRDRVVVRGPIRTWTVSLADAETFEPGIQPSFGNGTPCPMLKRRNGRAIGVWALGREGIVTRYGQYLHELAPICDELNEALRSVAAERAGGSGSAAASERCA